MSRYAIGQTAFAVAVTLVGVVKAIRIIVDWVDDNTTHKTGLR